MQAQARIEKQLLQENIDAQHEVYDLFAQYELEVDSETRLKQHLEALPSPFVQTAEKLIKPFGMTTVK